MNSAANSPPTPGLPRLVVLLSGSGRSLANLIETIAAGRLQASIELVVASRGDVRGVEIARAAAIPTEVISPQGRSVAAWSEEIFAACRKAVPDLVVMAGFLHLVQIPADFSGRVINIHPSLLPAFGGQGFHGLHVHRAVLARGCTVSGCTVHLVTEGVDQGRVLGQAAVPVLDDDTPTSLAQRVLAAEHDLYPRVLAEFCRRP